MCDLIEEFQPALCVHGHVHARLDYRIGSTRVVPNAFGSPWERTGHEPELVLEVREDTP